MNTDSILKPPVHFRHAEQRTLASALEDVSLTSLDMLQRIDTLATMVVDNLRSAQPEQVSLYNVRSVVELIALIADEARNDISVSLERHGLPGCLESIMEAQANPQAKAPSPSSIIQN